MNAISRVLLSSFVFLTFSSIAQADGKFWDKNSKHYESKDAGSGYWSGDRQDDYYARTNPHYGQVDSDGILSPGEIPNPLINYHYKPADYKNYNSNNYHHQPYYDDRRPVQNNGWQNSWDKKPCHQKDQEHHYQWYDSRWTQGSGNPYYRNR